MDKMKWKIIGSVCALLITLSIASFILTKELYPYLILVIPLIVYQAWALYQSQILVYKEIAQFTSAIHYRDFSRNFNERSNSVLQPIHKNFNEISRMFQLISREKETQYLYLQKILELVDTGILSYEAATGEVIWMNESLKKMLNIPFLKTIHSLIKRDERLYEDVVSLKPGSSKVASILTKTLNTKILLSGSAFQTDGKKFFLVAFQNINEAMDETESNAWKKLLSVLTHEIMNSIAPISSLSDTLKDRLNSLNPNMDSENALADLELGISTIKKRSEGLLRFAASYRNLNKISKPNLQKLYVRDLFENLHTLMHPTLLQKNIELEVIIKDPALSFEADLTLVEQVLINLLLNAMEAVKSTSQAKIILYGAISDQRTILKVIDNGIGIEDELLEKIFVPFFSTRKTGSGIGLTLCKQIMMLHSGNVQVQTVPGKGTSFILQF
jgi:two-component system nitrogen regulation sensor histidine kinase NtrY